MKKSKKSKIKNIFLGALAVLAVIGVGAFAVQAIPTTNQDTTIKPGDTTQVGGGLNYNTNLVKTGHYFNPTNGWGIPGSTSFNGELSTLSNGIWSGGSAGYGSVAHIITMSQIWNNDFGEGFESETLQYSTSVKVDEDTMRAVTYSDTNTFANMYEVGTTTYWVNGEQTTYENLSTYTTQGYYLTGSYAVVDYTNEKVNIHHYAIVLNTGVYESADGSVVLQLNEDIATSSFQDGSGSQFSFQYGMLGGMRGDGTGFSYNFSYQPASGDFQYVELKLTDYNKLSYNGIELTPATVA